MYIVRCADDSLYTGITKDLKRRIYEHNSDDRLGAKSLRYRRPVSLVYYQPFAIQAKAASREREIKGWNRLKKLELVSKGLS